MSELASFFQALWSLLADTGWWLIVGFAAAGLVHAFVPADALKRFIGRPGPGSSVRASLAGVLLPLCSCSVIPVAAGLRRAGASRGATASFAISTPQTGEESIPITWALFGPLFAITRPIAALLTAAIAGTLIDLTEAKADADAPRRSSDAAADRPCCGGGTTSVALPIVEPAPSSCCSAPPSPGIASRLRSAVRYAFVTLPLDLAPWLAAGFVLSAIIAAAVPPGWFGEHIGTGIGAMALMLVVGIPLYICATSSTPLAYTLVVAGVSPGAALVLLLAGPATNAATIAWALRDLGLRGTAIYLTAVAGVALAAGLAFDAIAPSLTIAESASEHAHGPGVFAMIGAGVISAILVWALAVRLARRFATGPSAADAPGGAVAEGFST